MINNLKYKLTNWIDGMKIQRKHFIDSENALLDRIRDTSAIHLTPFSFGLLAPFPGEKKTIEISLQKSPSDAYRVVLTLCRGITAGGSRIEILPEANNEIVSNDWAGIDQGKVKSQKNAALLYYAVVTVDHFDRNPQGEPAADETPPRHPFAGPRYELNLMESETIAANDFGIFHLPVARFKVKNGELINDSTYIPPCADIQGHPGMVQVYKTIGGQFNRLQESGTTIVQKVIAKTQNTTLAQNVRKLAEQNVRCATSLYFGFRSILAYQAPVYIAQASVELVNAVKMFIDFLPDKEKEEMLQYFKEWHELTHAAFAELLAGAIDTEYDHYNIFDSFQPLLDFLNRWADLFDKLAELELIGKRKEKELFVRELDVAESKPQKKKGFSVLGD